MIKDANIGWPFATANSLLVNASPSLGDWLRDKVDRVADVVRRALTPPGDPAAFEAMKVGSVITFSTGKGQPDSVGTILFVSHTADPKWSRAVIQRHGGGVFELYAAKWAQYNVRGA